MKPNLSTVTFAGHRFLPLTVVTASLIAGCAPDSSVGGDSVPGNGGSTGSSAGAPSAGQPGGAAGNGVAGSGTAGSGIAGSDLGSGVAGSGLAGSGVAGSGGGNSSGGTAGASSAGGAATAGAGGQVVGGGKGGPGGPSLCSALTGATLCDGFEGAAPGTTGSAWSMAMAATVDTTKFYRGSKSVKISGTTAFITTEDKTFTGTTKATNNNHWGRYFFLTDLGATPDAGHVVFARLTNGTLDFHFAGGSRGVLQAEIANGGDQYTNAKDPPIKIPLYPKAADGWQCWEWHVTADDSFNFYVNNVEVTDMAIVKGVATKSKAKFPLPIFGSLQLGYQSFNKVAMTGWIDEVAIGSDRIGCGF